MNLDIQLDGKTFQVSARVDKKKLVDNIFILVFSECDRLGYLLVKLPGALHDPIPNKKHLLGRSDGNGLFFEAATEESKNICLSIHDRKRKQLWQVELSKDQAKHWRKKFFPPMKKSLTGLFIRTSYF